MTLNIALSVGRSGITMCMGIQKGGFELELHKGDQQHKRNIPTKV